MKRLAEDVNMGWCKLGEYEKHPYKPIITCQYFEEKDKEINKRIMEAMKGRETWKLVINRKKRIGDRK